MKTGGSTMATGQQPSKRGRPSTRGTSKEKPSVKEGTSRRTRNRSSSPEDEGTLQECKSKLPKNTSLKPSQLFRKDLISAMKLPDSEHLSSEDYWLINDPWRQEWEQPVQVPVCPNQLPASRVVELRPKIDCKFRLPKRYLCLSAEKAKASKEFVQAAATQVPLGLCTFDLDELDMTWLDTYNQNLEAFGMSPLSEEHMEKAIYNFELQANEIFQKRKKLEEGLGLEYDENVVCEVCKSPDSYEHNEIVFCDACNISLHQYCYGIPTIPEGTWLCQPCARGVRPSCVLCPNQGGAMKLLKDGSRWIHVSCAIWIPEVDIEKLDHMAPIGGIENIPETRWSLQCSLCHIKEGACVQCSVKCCAVAYHVICGYQHNLEMAYNLRSCLHSEASFFESFCLKHTKERKKPQKSTQDTAPKTPTKEENNFSDRQQRIKALQERFYEGVSLEMARCTTDIELNHLYFFFNYWKLKRRSNFSQPLYSFATNQRTLSHVQEDNTFQKIKTCIRLRQDFERIRNLCYMVSRREKLFKSWIQVNKDIAFQQLDLTDQTDNLTEEDFNFIVQAGHGNSIYDMVYKSDHPLADVPPTPEGTEKRKKGRKRKLSLDSLPPSVVALPAKTPTNNQIGLAKEKPQKRAYRRRLHPTFRKTSLGRKFAKCSKVLPNSAQATAKEASPVSGPFNMSNIKKNVPKIFKALQIFKARSRRGRKRLSPIPESLEKLHCPSTPPPECKTPTSPKSPENPYAKHYLRQSIERAAKKLSLDSAEPVKKEGTEGVEAIPSESSGKFFRKCKVSNSTLRQPPKGRNKESTSTPLKASDSIDPHPPTNTQIAADGEDDKCNRPPAAHANNPPNRTSKNVLTNRLNRTAPYSPRKGAKHELKENQDVKISLDKLSKLKLGMLTIPCDRIDAVPAPDKRLPMNGVLKEAIENSTRFPSRRKNFS